MKNLSATAIVASLELTPAEVNSIESGHRRGIAKYEAAMLIQIASKAAAKAIAVLAGQAANATAQRQLAAIQLCLTSATGLLEISETLLVDKNEPTPYEQALGWQRLSEDAKGAGRAAYRAVLILADPIANQLCDIPPPGHRLN